MPGTCGSDSSFIRRFPWVVFMRPNRHILLVWSQGFGRFHSCVVCHRLSIANWSAYLLPKLFFSSVYRGAYSDHIQIPGPPLGTTSTITRNIIGRSKFRNYYLQPSKRGVKRHRTNNNATSHSDSFCLFSSIHSFIIFHSFVRSLSRSTREQNLKAHDWFSIYPPGVSSFSTSKSFRNRNTPGTHLLFTWLFNRL